MHACAGMHVYMYARTRHGYSYTRHDVKNNLYVRICNRPIQTKHEIVAYSIPQYRIHCHKVESA